LENINAFTQIERAPSTSDDQTWTFRDMYTDTDEVGVNFLSSPLSTWGFGPVPLWDSNVDFQISGLGLLDVHGWNAIKLEAREELFRERVVNFFMYMDSAFKHLDGRVMDRFDTVNTVDIKVDTLKTTATTRFNTVDTNAAAFNAATTTRFTTVDTKVDTLQTTTIDRFTTVDTNVAAFQTTAIDRFTTVDTKVADLKTTAIDRFNTVDTNVAAFQATAITRFTTVDNNVAALQTTADIILNELQPEYLVGVKNNGCDGIDQDGNDVADNCEEDQFPPSLVHRDGLAISSTCLVTSADYCLEPTFKTLEDAKKHLHTHVKVEDDCAAPDDLVTDIVTGDLQQLCQEIITMTPVHKHPQGSTCGDSSKGKPEMFAVKVDNSAPVITCGFEMWTGNPKTRFQEGNTLIVSAKTESEFVDTSFSYHIEVSIQSFLSWLPCGE
jgi:hypothetical protein